MVNKDLHTRIHKIYIVVPAQLTIFIFLSGKMYHY